MKNLKTQPHKNYCLKLLTVEILPADTADTKPAFAIFGKYF
jgi:hypothetical protein